MFTNATNKFWSLVLNSLANVDGLKFAFKCACGWASQRWIFLLEQGNKWQYDLWKKHYGDKISKYNVTVGRISDTIRKNSVP